MTNEAHLWLVRHAPVDGPRGIIHDTDAPANTSDAARLVTLRAELPSACSAICSPARRAWETALALGLDPVKVTAFREQSFGAWTGRCHDDLAAELGGTYQSFWRAPASNRPPGGESFVDQIIRVRSGLAVLPAGDVVLIVHSGTVRAALAIALDIAPDSALRFVIDTLSVTRIDRLDNGWRVVAVNRVFRAVCGPEGESSG
jgi:alpha-ribazole phosphatase